MSGQGAAEQGAERRLHVGHHQRRRQSLAGDVGDAEQEPRSVRAGEIERVVVIAAALPGRPVSGDNLIAGNGRQHRGEETGLDPRREIELAFQLGARDLDRLVQRQQPLALVRRIDRPLE